MNCIYKKNPFQLTLSTISCANGITLLERLSFKLARPHDYWKRYWFGFRLITGLTNLRLTNHGIFQSYQKSSVYLIVYNSNSAVIVNLLKDWQKKDRPRMFVWRNWNTWQDATGKELLRIGLRMKVCKLPRRQEFLVNKTRQSHLSTTTHLLSSRY